MKFFAFSILYGPQETRKSIPERMLSALKIFDELDF